LGRFFLMAALIAPSRKNSALPVQKNHRLSAEASTPRTRRLDTDKNVGATITADS
jgi:hypothetical protein